MNSNIQGCRPAWPDPRPAEQFVRPDLLVLPDECKNKNKNISSADIVFSTLLRHGGGGGTSL